MTNRFPTVGGNSTNPTTIDTGTEDRSNDKISHLTGFGPLTTVNCSFGDVPAHVLRERDMVRSKTGGFVAIHTIDRVVLDEDFMRYHPRAHPVMIRAGALGVGLPKNDILLAPYQTLRMSPQSAASAVRAVDLLGKPNVLRKPEAMISYTRFNCDRPVTVLVQGLWVDIAPRAAF